MRSHCPYIPCILIANKIDINYEVTKKSFQFPQVHNLPFFYVSAADGTNVVQIFDEALRLAIEYKKNPPDSYEVEIMELLKEVSFNIQDNWMFEENEKQKVKS